MSKSMKIINGDEAVEFLRDNKANQEHVDIDGKGQWRACSEDGTIVGVAAIRKVGNVWRVKGLFVAPTYRGHGVGSNLVETILDDIKTNTDGSKRITTFATNMSRPIFEKNGFTVKNTNKNGIHFMEKEIITMTTASKKKFVSPAYGVRAVPVDQIDANAYNPNKMAIPEDKLLYESIKDDGYTMPIVCYQKPDGRYEIVDGYHRYTTMLKHKDIYDREDGKLPVTVIDKPIEDRIASTIRHNRARGTHDVDLMVNIVKELKDSGMSDQWIMKNIGMSADELLRLKQVSGIAALFADKSFSHAWK